MSNRSGTNVYISRHFCSPFSLCLCCEKMYRISCCIQLCSFQMASSDKDFRFMATNDLMGELQKDSIKLDDDSERKVVKMLLRLLEDKNGEVQNLAVSWFVNLSQIFVK